MYIQWFVIKYTFTLPKIIKLKFTLIVNYLYNAVTDYSVHISEMAALRGAYK